MERYRLNGRSEESKTVEIQVSDMNFLRSREGEREGERCSHLSRSVRLPQIDLSQRRAWRQEQDLVPYGGEKKSKTSFWRGSLWGDSELYVAGNTVVYVSTRLTRLELSK